MNSVFIVTYQFENEHNAHILHVCSTADKACEELDAYIAMFGEPIIEDYYETLDEEYFFRHVETERLTCQIIEEDVI